MPSSPLLQLPNIGTSLHTTLGVLLLASATSVSGQSAHDFQKDIQPILADYCVKCHNHKKDKGDLNIEALNPDMISGPDGDIWHAMLDAVNRAEMPPEEKPQPKDSEKIKLIEWLTEELDHAASQRKKTVKTVPRRLNRKQYSNTLQDLLGIDLDFGRELPDDALSAEGFKNNGASLNLTALHLDYYMRIARKALDKAIFLEEQPEIHRFKITLGENLNPDLQLPEDSLILGNGSDLLYPQHFIYDDSPPEKPFKFKAFERPTDYTFIAGYRGNATVRKERRFTDWFHSVFVDFRHAKRGYKLQADGIDLQPIGRNGKRELSPNLKVVLREYPTAGSFRIKIKASRRNGAEAAPLLRAFMGRRNDDGQRVSFIGEPQKVSNTEPQIFEFQGRFENFPLPAYEPDNDDYLGNLIHIGLLNEAETKGSKTQLRVHEIDFEGPYFEMWPPASHQKIFSKNRPEASEVERARSTLQSFLRRAYRRPPTTDELALMLEFWQELRQEFPRFEESIKETLIIALSSPQFLYIHESHEGKAEGGRPLNDHELANRLSYFLWNSMPDEELFRLADTGTLRDQLEAQITRMIQHPRSWKFVTEFTDQWLDVSRIDRVAVSEKEKKYNEQIRTDLKYESYGFFNELLQKNEPLTHVVDSPFVFINERLARFYDIADVKGPQFRRVAIPSDSLRGGFLTQSSILTGHSSGNDSNPIKRGVWLTKHILGNPPPPAPPGVPPLDQENPELAKLPLKIQLEKHRSNPSCFSCHQKIDPWGVAFEKYDTIGQFRENNPTYIASATLPDGKTIDGLNELKDYLLSHRQEDVTRSLAKHMLSYALGRSLSFADGQELDHIVSRVSAQNHHMQSLVQAIITSPSFTNR